MGLLDKTPPPHDAGSDTLKGKLNGCLGVIPARSPYSMKLRREVIFSWEEQRNEEWYREREIRGYLIHMNSFFSTG